MEKLPKARNEMDVPKTEEKKLTNEATIDSLKEMAVKFSKDTYVNRVLVNAINLIHRLQDEIEQLKCDTYKTSWKGKFLEAKKENERMAEKNNEIFQRYLNVIDKNNDLQNQVDKVEAEKEDLYRSNERLQKQVDELKKTISIKVDYIDRVESEVVEWQFATKKSVKNTAKEICKAIHEDLQADLFYLKHSIFDTERQKAQEQQNIGIIAAQDAVSRFEKKIKERYGLEVE